MAPALEISTVQLSKDLRSEEKEYKRARNSVEKWHYGSRLKAGVKPVYEDDDGLDICQAAVSKTKVRPSKKPEKCSCCNPPAGNHQNIVKARSAWGMPPRRVLSTRNALDEMHDPDLTRSLIEELAGNGNPRLRRRLTASSSASTPAAAIPDVYYSYDLADSPATKAALEDYVRPGGSGAGPVARATDRLVAREYEVLDLRGDVVRGRRARANLRKADSAPVEETAPLEDDGFELV